MRSNVQEVPRHYGVTRKEKAVKLRGKEKKKRFLSKSKKNHVREKT